MNPSTALATVVVDELIRNAVRDVVLAPGSRSAALALALADREAQGDVRLHVRVDERSAGFLALGLAKASSRPVAVVTTSGTAAVNLHPAVTEASYAGIPLLLLTADRPPELRGTGANQAIDQLKLFGSDARWFVEVGVPRAEPGQVRYWRSLVSRSVAVAGDPLHPGPVHLNLAFAEPLVPDDASLGEWVEPLDGREGYLPWTVDGRVVASLAQPIDEVLRDVLDIGGVPARGLVIVGDTDDTEAVEMVDDLAGTLGWPVVGEPSGNASMTETAIRHGSVLLGVPAFADAHVPEIVVTLGRVGLSRSVLRCISRAGLHLAVDARPIQSLSDPTRTADGVVGSVPLPPEDIDGIEVDPGWMESWLAADELAGGIIDDALADVSGLCGPQVVREVAGRLDDSDLLVVGPSWPSRHVEAFAGVVAGHVIANRGTSGIDGVVSTAWGAALHWESGTTYALLGDLTALYDRNGLVAPVGEGRPDLVLVVIDNDGGGIFSQLEQARFPERFERVFGTPPGIDLATALAGVPVTAVATLGELTAALVAALDSVGPRVILARTISREDEANLLVSIRERVADGLRSAGSRPAHERGTGVADADR